MKIQKRIIAAAAGAAAVVLASHSASATVLTCAPSIEKEAITVAGKLEAALTACDKGYRTDQIKTPGTFSKSAAACQKQLDKGYTAQIAKSLAALTKLTTGGAKAKCTDADLGLLGHMLTKAVGDDWAKAVIAGALQHGYDTEITGAQDTVNMLMNMGTAGGCATCSTLATAPCYEHSCKYLTAGASGANTQTSVLNIDVPLTGVTNFKLCNVAALSHTGKTLVVGSVGKVLDPAPLPGIGFACVNAIGAEGLIGCNLTGSPAGSAPAVSIKTCMDSDTTVDKGSCPAGTTDVCTPLTNDSIQHPGATTTNSSCIGFSTAGAAAGSGFVSNNTQITVVLNSQLGADGKPCTPDDAPTTPGTPAANPLTTATADTQVLNADGPPDGTTILNGPVTGAPFPCSTIQSSNLAGASVAGAFPAPNAILGSDSVTQFTITCQ